MRKKVYLDITKSPFKLNYKGLTFIFSSETNMNKFNNQIDEFINHESFKIKAHYSYIEINFDLFLSLALYKKIEKRGFLVYDGEITLTNDLIFLASFVAKGKHF